MSCSSWSLSRAFALAFALLFFTGCSPLDVVCGSSRPKPVIVSLSPTPVTMADVQTGFVLTVNGSHFVAASVVIINGTTMNTTVVSSEKLKVTITSALITQAGSSTVSVHTTGGTSGDIGCSSGGDSASLILTVT